MKKVGLLIICSNKYIEFLSPLLRTADLFFLPEVDVTYFVFTDRDIETVSKRKITKIDTVHKPWPWMTLGRYDLFTKASDQLKDMDYLFYCDADMLFVSTIGTEILGDRVATQHPGLYGTRGTPETRPWSLACIHDFETMQYFAGGFNGGTSEEFLKMSSILSDNINEDYKNGIIAIWHDESHMNRYFVDNPPTVRLDPGYCYGEVMRLPFKKRLIALEKNHTKIR